jgi:hypothetical protein
MLKVTELRVIMNRMIKLKIEGVLIWKDTEPYVVMKQATLEEVED